MSFVIESVAGEPFPEEEPFGTSGRPSAVGSWAINVRDGTLARQAEIDDYTELTLITRFNAVGAWSITVHRAARYADELLEPRAGIIAVKGDRTILSGPALFRSITRRGENHTLTVSGVDDNVWLARRLAHPQPGATAPPYSTSAYDVRTGICSTILREYVDVNAGPGATGNRQVTGLVIGANPGVGASITGRARWQELLELLAELALAGGGLGFKIVQVDDTLEFQVYEPADLTASIKFSDDLGNLGDYTYELTTPDANYVICGGGGEGTARTIREGSDSTSVARWGRIERFVDRRDTTDTAELTQAITETLEEAGERGTLEYTPFDLTRMAALDHYDLGDRVAATVEGVTIENVIREIEFDFSSRADAVDITPYIAPPGRRDLLTIYDDVRRLHRRMTSLERR